MIGWKFALLVALLGFTLTWIFKFERIGKKVRERDELAARERAHSERGGDVSE